MSNINFYRVLHKPFKRGEGFDTYNSLLGTGSSPSEACLAFIDSANIYYLNSQSFTSTDVTLWSDSIRTTSGDVAYYSDGVNVRSWNGTEFVTLEACPTCSNQLIQYTESQFKSTGSEQAPFYSLGGWCIQTDFSPPTAFEGAEFYFDSTAIGAHRFVYRQGSGLASSCQHPSSPGGSTISGSGFAYTGSSNTIQYIQTSSAGNILKLHPIVYIDGICRYNVLSEWVQIGGTGQYEMVTGSLVPGAAEAVEYDPLILELDTAGRSQDPYPFELPIGNLSYNSSVITIDWGDGVVDTFTRSTLNNPRHTYTSSGTYTVRVYSNEPIGIRRFGGKQTRDFDLITKIVSWGDHQIEDISFLFAGFNRYGNRRGENYKLPFDFIPNTLPSNVKSLRYLFANNWYIPHSSSLEDWDVSNIEDMSYMFYQNSSTAESTFNGKLPWTASNCSDFTSMFEFTAYNNSGSSDCLYIQSTPPGCTMKNMFKRATSFNQPINGWNTSNVVVMKQMFDIATSFNQDLNSWDVSNVTDMERMFGGAIDFNGNISSWNTSNVENMGGMFSSATSFNQDIGGWDVSNVRNFNSFLFAANAFEHSLLGWCVNRFPTRPKYFDDGVGTRNSIFFSSRFYYYSTSSLEYLNSDSNPEFPDNLPGSRIFHLNNLTNQPSSTSCSIYNLHQVDDRPTTVFGVPTIPFFGDLFYMNSDVARFLQGYESNNYDYNSSLDHQYGERDGVLLNVFGALKAKQTGSIRIYNTASYENGWVEWEIDTDTIEGPLYGDAPDWELTIRFPGIGNDISSLKTSDYFTFGLKNPRTGSFDVGGALPSFNPQYFKDFRLQDSLTNAYVFPLYSVQFTAGDGNTYYNPPIWGYCPNQNNGYNTPTIESLGNIEIFGNTSLIEEPE